ncbi:MAG TPA: glycosyltransferase family 1 protein [Candidatus Cybelea sp.]|nr:glycosyltransferase family 1 protein [Candidatus Cybelea sp.]
MRIAVDAQLGVGTATGIGEYVNGLVGALRARDLDVVALREPKLDPWRFDRRLLWDQVLLPSRARRSGAALLHCAAGTMPFLRGMPVVVTVHDVAWLHVQGHARAYARWYFGSFSLARYRQASAIAVDSAFSRESLLEVLPNAPPVHVVYPGVAAEFCDLPRQGGDGRTILAVGTVERRKNLELLLRALPALPGARLVSVGPPTPYARECENLASSLGVSERFERRGYVARKELLALYHDAAVVAVPSRYEGFGYAAAQALCAGVPCIVSDRSSLPEIAGGDAPVAGCDDLDAWVALLRAALNGEADARAAVVRAGAIARFSWDAAVAQMQKVYDSALC